MRDRLIWILTVFIFMVCGYFLGGGGWHVWQWLAPVDQPIISLGKADDLLLWLNPISLLIFRGRCNGEGCMISSIYPPILGVGIGLAMPFLLQRARLTETKILIVGLTLLLGIVSLDLVISAKSIGIAASELSGLQH